MANALRTLSALALLAVLTPFASAQDCTRIPTSAGAPDLTYQNCAQPTTDNPVVSGPTDNSFGHDGVDNNFVTFQQNTPGVFTTVGSYAPPVFLGALDFEGNNFTTAFGLDTGGDALSINALTGAVTTLGNLQPLNGEQWTAITYDYTTNQFFALASVCGSTTSLYRVDFSPLSRTLVGTDNTGNETCGLGLAAHPTTGVLYGYGVVSDQMMTYNKTTGQSTVLGPLGYSANFGQSMDFDNADNTLYVYAFNDISFQAELRTANLSTGNTTLVGGLGTTVPGGLHQIGAGASVTATETGCEVSFNSASINPTTVAPGGTFQVAVDVRNTGGPTPVNLQLVATGPVNRTINLGSGTLPTTNSLQRQIPVRVPGNAPSGVYTLAIGILVDGELCDSETATLTVTAPRVGTEGPADFEVAPVDFSASAVTTSSATASPNPFAGQTAIRFGLDASANVRLSVYDVLGRQVAVLVDGTLEAGQHTATFDARGLSSGTYVYRLVTGASVQTGRITLAN